MKTGSAGAIALLNTGGPYKFADLYDITLQDGTVLHWSGGDVDYDFSYGGNTYARAGAPLIMRGPLRETAGLAINSVDLALDCGAGAVTYGGIPLVAAAINGLFDGARVVFSRAVLPDFGDPSAGAVVRFTGQVADVRPSSAIVVLIVESDLVGLNVQMPRNIITPNCNHVLFDPGCGLVKATYAVTSTAAGGSTVSQVASALGQAAGYFNLGVFLWTSGANTGARRSIVSFASGTFTLDHALAVTPTIGDGFTVWPGCDKLATTCNTKFSNLTRFRGFPYVPRPEVVR